MANAKPRPLRLTAVQLDGIDTEDGSPIWFPAYTTGERWNGFATPMFDRMVADQIMRAFNAKPKGTRASFDKSQDAYVFRDKDGEVETFKSVKAEGKVLYPIGAWFWAWTSNEGEN